jgi:hypothetical protein
MSNVFIQFKFLNPLADSVNKEFKEDETIIDIIEFIIEYLQKNKWPKYSKEEVQLMTVYPTRTFTFVDHSLMKITQISKKRFQMTVKVVQSFMSTLDESINEKQTIPHFVTCSISKNLLIHPVITKCGHIYEKENILKWIEIKPTCPVCDKSVRDESEISNAPKELKDKIVAFVENSDSIPLEIKEKYKQTIKKIKERKMLFTKAKGKAKKIEIEERSQNEEFKIWINNSLKNVWFFQLNNQCIPLSLKLINFINQTKLEFILLEGKWIHEKDDFILDIKRKSLMNVRNQEFSKLFSMESKDSTLWEYEVVHNEWTILNEFTSSLLHASVELGIKSLFIEEENSYFDFERMVRIKKPKEFKFRKILEKKIKIVWKHQIDEKWVEYDEKTSKLIETVFSLKMKSTNITTVDGKFKISFGEMTATHSENNLIYNIRRVE